MFLVFVLNLLNACNLKRYPHKDFETIEEAKKFYDYHEQFLFECLRNDKLDLRNPMMIYKHLKRKYDNDL